MEPAILGVKQQAARMRQLPELLFAMHRSLCQPEGPVGFCAVSTSSSAYPACTEDNKIDQQGAWHAVKYKLCSFSCMYSSGGQVLMLA